MKRDCCRAAEIFGLFQPRHFLGCPSLDDWSSRRSLVLCGRHSRGHSCRPVEGRLRRCRRFRRRAADGAGDATGSGGGHPAADTRPRRHGVPVDVARRLRPQGTAFDAARRHGRHRCRLADGGRRYRRHGAVHRRHGRAGLRGALGLSAIPARRAPRRGAEPGGGARLGYRFGLYELRGPCRRAALPGLYAAPAARPQGSERHWPPSSSPSPTP